MRQASRETTLRNTCDDVDEADDLWPLRPKALRILPQRAKGLLMPKRSDAIPDWQVWVLIVVLAIPFLLKMRF